MNYNIIGKELIKLSNVILFASYEMEKVLEKLNDACDKQIEKENVTGLIEKRLSSIEKREGKISQTKDTIECPSCGEYIIPIKSSHQWSEDEYAYEETCPYCDYLIKEHIN